MIGGFELPTGGPDRAPRARRDPRPAGQAAGQHGLPELRAVPPPERRRQHRVRAAAEERRQGPDRATRPRGARAGPPRRLREAQAEPAERRPAAARRAGPGAREPAQRPAPRRAARRARPEAPQAAPDRAQARPGRGRDHVRLRDPRPGGGAHDERPDRGHEPRQGRAARDARGALRAADHPVRRGLHRHDEPAQRVGRIGRRCVGARPARRWRHVRRRRRRAARSAGRSSCRIRPESILIKASNGTAPGGVEPIRGQVEQMAYLGGNVQYHVRTQRRTGHHRSGAEDRAATRRSEATSTSSGRRPRPWSSPAVPTARRRPRHERSLRRIHDRSREGARPATWSSGGSPGGTCSSGSRSSAGRRRSRR